MKIKVDGMRFLLNLKIIHRLKSSISCNIIHLIFIQI